MKVLVVDDDRRLNDLVCGALRSMHISPESVCSLPEARKKLSQSSYDLIILDWMFDGEKETGFDLAQEITKQYPDLPILMLTGRNFLLDKVKALDAGVDDYLVKPFHLPELVARIKTIIRRKRLGKKLQEEISVGSITLDTNSYELRIDSKVIEITSKEFQIMHLLMQNIGHVVTRKDLIKKVWGAHSETLTSNTIDVHMRKLRSRLGKLSKKIFTIRGIGYRMSV